MPSRETRGYELNEVSWWERWVDETAWISKNSYAIFSAAFKDDAVYNRGGFLGVERVPKDAVEAIEEEFAKRKRGAPTIFVEEGRPWDRMRACLSSKGYVERDRMLVMEGASAKGKTRPEVTVERVSASALGEWTRVYLQAFYGDQKLSEKVNSVMRKVSRDSKASVLLARVGGEPAGCAAVYRSAGGVAGAYCIGTAPEYRGRGVGAAMVAHMRALAEREKRRLILQTLASDGVEGFYLKQGFRRAYVKGIFEKGHRPRETSALPSGEAYGVRINRDAAPGKTVPFADVFEGFHKVDAVRGLFGPATDQVFAKLKVSLSSSRGYLRVDGETGDIIVNPEYLKAGDERHLYLDVIHELTHVRQFREGKELYDRRYAYFERPTEVEAYRVAVEEARKIGMDREEIVEYLRVEWVTEDEFLRFVKVMGVDED